MKTALRLLAKLVGLGLCVFVILHALFGYVCVVLGLDCALPRLFPIPDLF